MNCTDIGGLPIFMDYSCLCRFVKDVVEGSIELVLKGRRTLGCRRSGPVDLYMFRWISFSCTSSSRKLNVSGVLPAYLVNCGMLFSRSWVKAVQGSSRSVIHLPSVSQSHYLCLQVTGGEAAPAGSRFLWWH